MQNKIQPIGILFRCLLKENRKKVNIASSGRSVLSATRISGWARRLQEHATLPAPSDREHPLRPRWVLFIPHLSQDRMRSFFFYLLRTAEIIKLTQNNHFKII